MSTTIYLDNNNALTHRLKFRDIGGSKIRDYNLSDATEIIIEFYTNRTKRKTLSSLSHPGITILDASRGRVQYMPQSSDFDGIYDLSRINLVQWVVKNPNNPSGLKFGSPALPVRIIR